MGLEEPGQIESRLVGKGLGLQVLQSSGPALACQSLQTLFSLSDVLSWYLVPGMRIDLPASLQRT